MFRSRVVVRTVAVAQEAAGWGAVPASSEVEASVEEAEKLEVEIVAEEECKCSPAHCSIRLKDQPCTVAAVLEEEGQEEVVLVELEEPAQVQELAVAEQVGRWAEVVVSPDGLLFAHQQVGMEP